MYYIGNGIERQNTCTFQAPNIETGKYIYASDIKPAEPHTDKSCLGDVRDKSSASVRFFIYSTIFKTITQTSLFFVIYVRTHRARSDLNTCTHEI
jgi:hypothetical protein